MNKISRDLIQVAKSIVAGVNYLGKLQKKPLGYSGAYRLDGRVDGIPLTVVWNPPDRELKTYGFWDVSVGSLDHETSTSRQTTARMVNDLISDMMAEEKTRNQTVSGGGLLPLSFLKDELDAYDHGLSDSEIQKLSKIVYDKLSQMTPEKRETYKRGARSVILDLADSGDENGWEVARLALTIIYAKSLNGQMGSRKVAGRFNKVNGLVIAKVVQAATDHAAASAVIKTLLKKTFPRTKFEVRSSSYSGGNSVSIRWADGPTSEAVNKLVSKYQYGSFDGMQDLYEYTNRDNSLPQVKFVLPSRSMTDKTKELITKEISEKFGIDMNDEDAVWKEFHAWPDSVIGREFAERSF